MKNRTIIGIVCMILAVAMTFAVAPLVNRLTSDTTTVVRLKQEVGRGAKITAEQVETVKVKTDTMPQGVYVNTADVVGKYASSTLYAGDILTKAKLTKDANSADDVFATLDGSKVAVSVTIDTFAAGLSGKLQNGDIISLIVVDKNAGTSSILFLDEISAAPQSVQAAAYQITLDRVVGEHKLPDNCIVIAAGNRMTDKSVAFKMPKALANRLMHIEIAGSFNSWKEWAIRSGINEKVLGFLSFRQSYLMGFDSSSDDLAFATPRSWEMVSNLLNCVSDDIDDMFSLISGIVGSGVAVEFRTWAKVYKDLPNIEDVFDGKTMKMPTGTDAMYALTASMTIYARDHKEEMSRIANSIRYAEKMPPDFSTVLMKDYMYIDKHYKEKLMTIPEFSKWLQTKGRLMNGSV